MSRFGIGQHVLTTLHLLFTSPIAVRGGPPAPSPSPYSIHRALVSPESGHIPPLPTMLHGSHRTWGNSPSSPAAPSPSCLHLLPLFPSFIPLPHGPLATPGIPRITPTLELSLPLSTPPLCPEFYMTCPALLLDSCSNLTSLSLTSSSHRTPALSDHLPRWVLFGALIST